MSRITIPTTLSLSGQTGFTSATVTTIVDTPQSSRAIQNAVTAEASGTFPSGMTFHSVSSPFTVTVERPAQFRTLGPVNPITGRLGSVPRNVYKIRTRKGVVPLAGQAPVTCVIETTISVPAGSDAADADNLRMAIGSHFGLCSSSAVTDEVGDMLADGVL